MELVDRLLLAMSVIVSVKAQKYGGLWVQPLGKQRGTPINCLWQPTPGSNTANSRDASGESRTL